MNNKLFVGNLAFSTTEDELAALFGEFGEVQNCSIPKDRDTGRVRGFAFVEMDTQSAAEAAIKGLNGHELGGRQISVVVSQPKEKSRRY